MHHAIAVAQAGDVVVIDAGGRSDVAMIGDLLSTAARRKGIVGLIADGAVRDTGILGGWDDFAWCSPATSPPAARPRRTAAPSMPRDDRRRNDPSPRPDLSTDDGVVVIPREAAEGLIAKAEERAQAEIGWEKRLSAGETTLAVFGVPDAVRGERHSPKPLRLGGENDAYQEARQSCTLATPSSTTRPQSPQ